jgi:hypothetical protein
MKTLLILTMTILIVITSLAAVISFQHSHYSFSALLVLTSFISVALWIFVISNKRVVLS